MPVPDLFREMTLLNPVIPACLPTGRQSSSGNLPVSFTLEKFMNNSGEKSLLICTTFFDSRNI